MIRAEGEKAAKDKAVNDAYDNVGHVLAFYKEKFNWKSLDNRNADVISSVHYGRQYENACRYYPHTIKQLLDSQHQFGTPRSVKWFMVMAAAS